MFDLIVGYAYYVSDLDRAIKFYTEMLGFKFLGRSDMWGERFKGLGAQVGLDEVVIHLRKASETFKPGGSCAPIFGVTDLEKKVAGLRALGVDIPDEIAQSPVGRHITFRDPDGNAIELFEPRVKSD